jgi:thiopurine S-methyltransferase
MEISYWQSRWNKNKTGWHMDSVYPPLPEIWSRLAIKPHARVLVPFCGKSLDLRWLTEQGHHVTGVDVSQKALHEVMHQNPHTFSQDSSHGFTIYRSDSLELWQGDFIKLPAQGIATPDIIYDKASIIAQPREQRKAYAQKVLELCGKKTRILLQTFEYKQEEMNGPPFSVDENEVRELLGQQFTITLEHEQSKMKELSKFQQRGLSSYLIEKIFYLEPRHQD